MAGPIRPRRFERWRMFGSVASEHRARYEFAEWSLSVQL